MHVLHVVGARPNFPKLAPVYRALRARGHLQTVVHTGQHYDPQLSAVFFEELGLPQPDHHLGIGSAGHGVQTGQMLAALEPVLLREEPAVVLVYGDTNSTLAGALAAAKAGLLLGHVEAGLRSYDRSMPEELNRVLTDHASDLLFCPTAIAVENLSKEGKVEGVHLVGDVMYDALLAVLPEAREHSEILERYGVARKRFILVTVHRAGNTDDPDRLQAICEALDRCDEPIVFPAHPRAAARLEQLGIAFRPHVRLVQPVPYLESLFLIEHARMVLTDSGGVQKEAYLLQTPSVTLRETTEWPETLAAGWNMLAGAGTEAVLAAIRRPLPSSPPPPVFGDGHAAEAIVAVLESAVSRR